ncbi:hypothetical protein RD792_007863 [Penstemon davidsonii]|uniref:receptor protein-tyrosine kinase n=1 Tax=Penstemon davidsonii TaxID=160366 RepID=A0ABR0D898_9LAMI|nr:hypothetical protein RD792_007863 [Penstemon davidsonii]
MKKQRHQLLLLLLPFLTSILFIQTQLTSAVDFIFNGFDSSNISLYGTSTIESRILTLTNDTTFSIGRAFYPSRIRTKEPNSSFVLPFSTSFIFAMAPYEDRLPGHGFVFFFVPHDGIQGASSAQNLGLFNFTNMNPSSHIFGVEFDVFENEEFRDINDNHVGIDVNSLISLSSYEAGYWDNENSFERLRLNNGRNYQVWIDYDNGIVNVTMAPVGMIRPNRPLLSVSLNLSDVFEDEMYVGFTASTGVLVQSHKILGWSFSNTNFSISEGLITRGLPSFELPGTPIYRTRGFIAGMVAGGLFLVIICSVFAFLFIRRKRRIRKEREGMEDWELEYWPHRLNYQEIDLATKNFSEENVIGIGGNGKVYKGVFPGGLEVAVKRISHQSSEGVREFLAEISSLGRLKHRNLVGLRGWCKKEKGSLILVYDYMENGSLDKRIFESDDQSKFLNFEERIKVLKQVASGVLYLHEEWEAKVLHRDIKSSNVLLDKEMNARLGDFGLARLHDHDKVAGTTQVVGTIGYIAPEIVASGRASTKTDVFGYGVLVLEVICGRRPNEEGKPPLVDWVWELLRKGELITAVDERLMSRENLDVEEVERVLHLGLLCAHPDPNARPTMRQVVKLFDGKVEVDESEGDDMNVYLLEKMKNREFWAMYPAFEDIRKGLSSSMSLSWSDSILEGLGLGWSGNECADVRTSDVLVKI